MPTETDTSVIHPVALQQAREKRGMTQGALAEAIGCTKDTVSRWERGKAGRVRPRLRQPLCETLGVKWEKLTQMPERDPDVREVSAGDNRLNESIPKYAHNALKLVSRRYNIRLRDILELAPLLFVIVAERSLLERRSCLDAIYDEIEKNESKMGEICGNMTDLVYLWRYNNLVNVLDSEEISIDRKDIFGKLRTHHLSSSKSLGPFGDFVIDLTRDIPEAVVSSIDAPNSEMIHSYRVAYGTLKELSEISDDDEESKIILTYIHRGRIDFDECLRVKGEEDEAGYRQWLRDECARIKEEARVKKEKQQLTGRNKRGKLIGISSDDETGRNLLSYISHGRINFDECLKIKRERDSTGYWQWLMGEYARLQEEDQRLLDELDSVPDSPASSAGEGSAQ